MSSGSATYWPGHWCGPKPSLGPLVSSLRNEGFKLDPVMLVPEVNLNSLNVKTERSHDLPKVTLRAGDRAGTRPLLSWFPLPWASSQPKHTVGTFSKELIITPPEMQTLTPILTTSASGTSCFLKMQRSPF